MANLDTRNLSVLFSGSEYKEFDIHYSVDSVRKNFPGCEVLLSTNDIGFYQKSLKKNIFDKIVFCEVGDELPCIKAPGMIDKSNFVNNNINKQVPTCLAGINAATHDVVLKIRTDQYLLNSNVLKFWNMLTDVPKRNAEKQGRIITTSVFSLNPRFRERILYHIADMMQFGYKSDLINYYSCPEYPFEYSVWYEYNKHNKYSTFEEKLFRSRYAVEQWLSLNYIFSDEAEFPVKYHNDCNPEMIFEYEYFFPDYFFIVHPEDIGLRNHTKFFDEKHQIDRECYSTFDSIRFIKSNYGIDLDPEGLYKNRREKEDDDEYVFSYGRIFDLSFKFGLIRFVVRNLPYKLKSEVKRLIRRNKKLKYDV
ncbi:hypothetical protein F9C28_19995 [Shimwellia pseudoproteus]|uniref:WavE lipopolysaccharide synthesis family protein n=1 Tax=Shimwellia pseudoproteus TaxID=570012 RepID=UPI0018EB13AA|nr:WavE lipopolysaccharide synthesis family protein [Shimwellia pseudoproteus]MBJ3817092.1 hypothetical protein [Shimwellia pseudoproteus]